MPRKSKRGMGGYVRPSLGPRQSIAEIEAAINICVNVIWDGEDEEQAYRAGVAAAHLKTILWSRYQTKGLEIKGLNMDGSAPEVKVILNDYAAIHEEQEKEIAALRAQNEALMQARERPRPPRPQMN